MSEPELSDALLEVGARLCPRRYRRFKDLRSHHEACEWARKLDWRQNPYDRFLLRRELLRHLESTESRTSLKNVFTFASREEIAAEVDRLLVEFPNELESVGIFNYVLVSMPFRLGFRHGRIKHSRLNQALAGLPKSN